MPIEKDRKGGVNNHCTKDLPQLGPQRAAGHDPLPDLHAAPTATDRISPHGEKTCQMPLPKNNVTARTRARLFCILYSFFCLQPAWRLVPARGRIPEETGRDAENLSSAAPYCANAVGRDASREGQQHLLSAERFPDCYGEQKDVGNLRKVDLNAEQIQSKSEPYASRQRSVAPLLTRPQFQRKGHLCTSRSFARTATQRTISADPIAAALRTTTAFEPHDIGHVESSTNTNCRTADKCDPLAIIRPYHLKFEVSIYGKSQGHTESPPRSDAKPSRHL